MLGCLSEPHLLALLSEDTRKGSVWVLGVDVPAQDPSLLRDPVSAEAALCYAGGPLSGRRQ